MVTPGREVATGAGARLRATLDSLLDPHVYLEAVRDAAGGIVDFVFVDANDAACDYNHRSWDEMSGTLLLETLPGHLETGIFAQYVRVVDSGQPLVADGLPYFNEFLRQDRICDVRGIRVGDGLSLTWRDVTERIEAARTLAESEERFRLLAEHASDVVYLAGPDRRIRYVSPAVERSLGWKPADLVGTVAADLVHPDDHVEVTEYREAVYEGREPPEAVARDGALLRVRSGSGEYRWFVAAVSTLFDESGALAGVVGSMRDVDDLVRTRAEARRDRARLSATIDSLMDPHAFLDAVRDPDGRIRDFTVADVNRAAAVLLGRTPHDILGRPITELLRGIETSGVLASFAAVIESGRPVAVDDFAYSPGDDAGVRRYDLRVVAIEDGLSCTVRDVTDRYLADAALSESERRYRLLAENSTDVVMHQRGGIVQWVSPSIAIELGWTVEDVTGTPSIDLVHPADREAVLAARSIQASGGTTRRRIRLRDRHGGYHWVDSHGGPFVNGSGQQDGVVVSLRIVDAEVRAQETLEARARQDTLTGLANRDAMFERVEAILRRSARTGAEIAVVFCDIDDFKGVNDTHGHAAGDEVLRTAAGRVSASVRSGDLVSRIGGDELLVVLDGVHDLEQAVQIADKLRVMVGLPIQVGGSSIRATMSVGVTLAGSGESMDVVVARADRAMYLAKERGRDTVVAFPGPHA